MKNVSAKNKWSILILSIFFASGLGCAHDPGTKSPTDPTSQSEASPPEETPLEEPTFSSWDSPSESTMDSSEAEWGETLVFDSQPEQNIPSMDTTAKETSKARETSGQIVTQNEEQASPVVPELPAGTPVALVIRHTTAHFGQSAKVSKVGLSSNKYVRKISVTPKEAGKLLEGKVEDELNLRGYRAVTHDKDLDRRLEIDLIEMDIRYYKEEIEPREFVHNAQLEAEIRVAAMTDEGAYKKVYKTALEQSFHLRNGEALRKKILDHALHTILTKMFEDSTLMAVLSR